MFVCGGPDVETDPVNVGSVVTVIDEAIAVIGEVIEIDVEVSAIFATTQI